MKSFADKVAVITGAASGIGAALAKKCASEKMKVVLADININKLHRIEKELKEINPNVISVITDVSIPSDLSNLANITLSHFKKVNLLFNNAGIGGPLGPIWEIDEEKLQKVININLMSIIYGLRTFIPIMLSQHEDCYIVNTASGAGLHTAPNMSGYVLTKHAVVALSEVLYLDLEQRQENIHVSVLCPGSVKTDLAQRLEVKEGTPKQIEKLAEFLKSSVSKGMSADTVAEQVFTAIKENQFYILTPYEGLKELVKDRMENILQRHNPVNPMPF